MTEVSIRLVLRRHTRLIGVCGIAGALMFSGLSLLAGREWISLSSFLPQSRHAPGGLSALAAQFGVAAPNGEGQLTPQFFADLLVSGELGRRLIQSKLDTGAGPRASLIQVLKVPDADSAKAEDAALRKLADRVETEVAPKTGLVSLRVRMPSARLAFVVNKTLIDLLIKFNLESRRSQAGAERRFSEARAAEASGELRQAENRQRDFLKSNRVLGSPDLVLERDRLAREVTMRQQLYTSLLEASEQARIDEVRDTPTITPVEEPHVPARPVSRHIVIRLLLGLLFGGTLGVAWGVAQEKS